MIDEPIASSAGRDGREPSDRTRPHLVIRPRSRWGAVSVAELWEFRDLFRSFAARDVRLRYRQTALGVVWVVLQPLIAALIFTLVFGRIAQLPSDGVPYLLFAFSGQLAWQAVSGTIARSATTVVSNASMVSKSFFPRMLLPLATLGSVMLDFLVGTVVMACLLVWYGVTPSLSILLLPLWLVLLLALATGIGLAAAGLAVRFRDVQHVVPVGLQFLLLTSPVAYSASAVPSSMRRIYDLNPLSGLLEGFRWSLLPHVDLNVGQSAGAGLVALLVLGLGAVVFASLERGFADVI